MASRGEIQFDGWTLRPSTGELLRDGVKVRLPVQALQLLEELLANPGEVVTREQLIARLWPRGVVDFDTALNTAVRRLRTALGDHADTPRYIETLPKRGYRFIGTVEMPAAAPTAPQPRVTESSDPVSAPPVGSATRGERPSRSAVLALAGLSVLALASWSWTRAQRAESGHAATRPAAVVEIPASAQQRLQQARFLMQRREPGDVARARDHFQAALQLQPRYARAWAGLASTWFLDVVEGRVARAEGLERMRVAANRALEIDPTVAEAHVRLANYARLQGDDPGAEAHLRRALAADPDDPLVLGIGSGMALERGDLDRAIELQRRAGQSDPLAVATRVNLAVLLYVAGRYSEASDELSALRELVPGPDTRIDLLQAQALVLAGDYEAALALGDRMDDAAARLQVRVLALHGLGRRTESDRALAELEREAAGTRALLLAEAHAFRGEVDPAFERLREAALDGARCGADACWPVSWLARLPLLQPLHDDARWAAWVADLERHAG